MKRPTLSEIVAVYARSNGMCALCGKPVDPDDATIDHIIPKSRGGEHVPDNWQLAHRRCNTRKGAKIAGEIGVPNDDGPVVKAWRDERKITQRQLADRLGVDPITVSRWERGEQKPPGRLLRLALEALDWRHWFDQRTDEQPRAATPTEGQS